MRLSLEKKKKKKNNKNNKQSRFNRVLDTIGARSLIRRSRFNRVLCTIGARSLIKAASSDGRDLAPAAPPPLASERQGNGEQYAFKKVNIEERVIVIYIVSNLLPAGGAMSIT